MKSDLNEQLCMKFAAEVLEVVSQVKKNRLQAPGTFQAPAPSEAKYFIRNADLKNFIQNADQSCCFYLALSVGQYYHEGVHALSQVACMENVRQSYEKWLQAGFSEFYKNSDAVVKQQWRVNLIVTDSHQALNDFPAQDIDFNVMQCLAFINNPQLQALEQKHIENGERLLAQYRRYFETCTVGHETNAKVSFDFAQSIIKWSMLKRFYQDPQFVAMVNHLERCLKFGLQSILTAIKEQKKLPSSIMKKVREGLFDHWNDVLKLNDISYVIVEIVMLYYKIFQLNFFDVQFQNKFLLYPGPLDVMLGVGRNLLAMQFKELVFSAKFSFLRMQNLVRLSENTDKEALIFAGELSESCRIVQPSGQDLAQRLQFISQEAEGKVNRAKSVLLAVNQAMEHKLAKKSRREKRRALEFLDSSYAQYLHEYRYYCERYGDALQPQLTACQFQWDAENPIASIDRLCALVDEPKENADSPRLSRLNSFVSEVYFAEKIRELRDECLKPLAKKFNSTGKPEKKKGYLTQLVCRLVQYAVDAKNEFESTELPSKRTKVDTISGVVKTCQQFFSGSLKSSTEGIEKEPEYYRRFQSLMIFCINNLGAAGVVWDDLFNPKYYPSTVPEVDYRSSQEPSQGSFPEMN